ncbi:MAG: helix-turn-helix domain-containing protein [Chloroflexi bacterium]|nr:helix-turn-helix domain-containing protein [Chloroflexota bacterium]
MALLTLVQAAEQLGVAPATLRAQIHRGKLRAQKLGRDWLVDKAEVERYRTDSLKRTGDTPPRGRRDLTPGALKTR